MWIGCDWSTTDTHINALLIKEKKKIRENNIYLRTIINVYNNNKTNNIYLFFDTCM